MTLMINIDVTPDGLNSSHAVSSVWRSSCRLSWKIADALLWPASAIEDDGLLHETEA